MFWAPKLEISSDTNVLEVNAASTVKLKYGIKVGTSTGIKAMEDGIITGPTVGNILGNTIINTKPVQQKQHQIPAILIIHQVVKQIHSATPH